ncbi:pyroglutamyl peptidase [Streptomyces gobiensis]|uniref:pyroglutamyl peptidase n=1 Tax=Streptomyces gobiensis TaxID=2875706 RepID=UPI001E577779|nr:pyroglutamyl peptidase [Streptomyces gobiensis]UGY92147.1 pyroglutamyl peptidase [Streptomyces gobiensis]
MPLRSRICVLAVCGALLAPTGTAVAANERGSSSCVRPDTPLTVEEKRLSGPVPQEILERSGFDRFGPVLRGALCAAKSDQAAERIVRWHGRALWQRAVDRVRGRGPAGGDLARDDDRPLYWARLEMSKAIREWRPAFPLAGDRRGALLDRLERTSRGQDSIKLPARAGVRRVLVTGFDPFQLDGDIRRSNPSGAAALALDGTTVRTPEGPARIEAAVFPVRWADFTRGTVETTLRPHFAAGPRQADVFTTISQGRVGRFDVERYNGAWRGGYPDNANESVTEQIPVPGGGPGPQWTSTSLPYRQITEADTGDFPVYDNTSVTEIPAGGTEPVQRPDGPTPGSTARAGGGGDYLSNEIAYRATLLRDTMGRDIPGGHLHTPVLRFAKDNTDPDTGTVTDPVFLRNRAAITAQIRAVLTIAAGSDG